MYTFYNIHYGELTSVSDHLAELAERHLKTREGLPDAIARTFRDAIFEGLFAPDQRLHQDEIAQQFGVSRVPVREALAKLVAEGLATQRLNKGIRVAPLSRADFQDIMELRLLLEPHALKLSAPHLTDRDYDAAEATLGQVRLAGVGAQAAALHWEFHNRLYSRCARPRLLGQISALQLPINRYVLPVWQAVGLSADWDDSHSKIVTALRSGDVDEAARMTAEQISEALVRMLDHLPMAEPPEERER